MRLEELDYELPPGLIAQQPAEPRDAARLLVYERARGAGGIQDRLFSDLPSLLRPGDMLVRNDTRVIAARTHFRRASGGRLEVLFLHPLAEAPASADAAGAAPLSAAPNGGGGQWEVLVRGRPRPGERLTCLEPGAQDWRLTVREGFGDGRWVVENGDDRPVLELLQRHGQPPLPPYITAPLEDPEQYQTVFATRLGSAAAPTAGRHFTRGLDQRLAAAGIEIVDLTLHVGLGTFRPLTCDVVADNRLHAERFEAPAAAWRRIAAARRQGRRIIAVGTTMTRLLEDLARRAPAQLRAADGVLCGSTSLFITPGFQFRVVGGVVTNFHLPRTSLLALVMAFCGIEVTRALYRHAVEQRYRFYSFGDAMLAV